MRKPRNYPEQDLQKLCAAYLHACAPPSLFWTAVNPIPAKSKAVAGLSKAMGLRPGVHDIILAYRGRIIGIEMKATKGRLSPNQIDMHEELTLAGGVSAVAHSLEEFIDVLMTLQIPMIGRVQ